MPRKKAEVGPDGQPVAAVPRKERVKIGEKTFALFLGGRSPKAFVDNEDEVKSFIEKTEAHKQGKIVVFKRVPLKIQTSVSF